MGFQKQKNSIKNFPLIALAFVALLIIFVDLIVAIFLIQGVGTAHSIEIAAVASVIIILKSS